MDIQACVEKCLKNLQALGIDVTDKEQGLIDGVLAMPANFLEDFEEYHVIGLLLNAISDYGYADRVYSFDTEVADIENMYSVFLARIATLTHGDLACSQIVENLDDAAYAAGIGIHNVRFQCGPKEYSYDAKAYYDWFDVGIIALLNQVLEEMQTGKYLYLCSDSWQNCVVFYETAEWARRFNETIGTNEFQALSKL